MQMKLEKKTDEIEYTNSSETGKPSTQTNPN